MTTVTTSSTARQSVLKHVPELALALAGIAAVLLALGPIGWRLGWTALGIALVMTAVCVLVAPVAASAMRTTDQSPAKLIR